MLDLQWGAPIGEPETRHTYGAGSCWRAVHPGVWSRILQTLPKCYRWAYYCPDEGTEGVLFYDGRKPESRPTSFVGSVGIPPYSSSDWWGFDTEEEASRALMGLLSGR
jgi:hypothetical protein